MFRSPSVATRFARLVKATLAASIALVLALSAAPGTAEAAKAPKSTARTTTAAAEPTYTNTKVESFATAGWWKTWGLTTAPWHTAVVTEGADKFMRVGFPAGSHNGTSFDWMTGTSDAAHIRYRIRLSSNWNTNGNGAKLPGFGKPTYQADGVCLGGCGLAPADGITSWSARGWINSARTPGSYLYTLGRTEYSFKWDTAPALDPGRWYTIDYWVTMNTPGQSNGVLRAAVDGTVVHQWTNMNFREVSSLHVNKAWFGFYYGGTGVPSEDMWIDVDDVTIDW